MSAGRTPPSQSVPTLTEVITWPPTVLATSTDSAPEATPTIVMNAPVVTDAHAALGAARSSSETELGRRVLFEVQRQVDLMLEVRLRESSTPLLRARPTARPQQHLQCGGQLTEMMRLGNERLAEHQQKCAECDTQQIDCGNQVPSRRAIGQRARQQADADVNAFTRRHTAADEDQPHYRVARDLFNPGKAVVEAVADRPHRCHAG